MIFRQEVSAKVLVASEVSRLVLGLVTIVILERLLGAAVLGSYLAVTVLAQLMARVLDLGLPHSVGYFLRIEPLGLHTCLWIFLRHSVLVVPVAALFAWGLIYFPFEDPASQAIAAQVGWAAALLALCEMIITLVKAALIPRRQYFGHVAINLAPPLIFQALLWQDILSIGADAMTGQSLVINLGLATGAVAVMSGLLLWQSSRGLARVPLSTKEIYGYASRTYAAALIKLFSQRFDRLLLTTLVGGSAYAYYSVAVSLRDMMVNPVQSYTQALRNGQIDLVAKERRLDKARRLLLRTSLLWIAIGTGLAGVAWPIWPIAVAIVFSPDFAPVAGFGQVLAFTCGPLVASSLAWNHLYALRRPGRVLFLTLGSLILSIPVFVGFISILDTGIAAAFSVLVWSVLSFVLSVVWAYVSSDATRETVPSLEKGDHDV